MFAAFNVKIDESDILGALFYEKGKEILEQQRKIIEMNLEKYICQEKYIDGNLLEEDWFPQIKSDVFLSHSHRDDKLVVALAGWLYEVLGLEAFVDSHIWGYSNDLLKILDDENCVKESKDGHTTYSYEQRNVTTSHVHMMLAMALGKMIDNTEALFFINTPHSIMFEEVMKSSSTFSPWIYAEIQMANMVDKKKLCDYRQQTLLEHSAVFGAKQELQIKYNVSFEQFVDLDEQDLKYLWKYGKKNVAEYPLDVLYERKGMLKEREVYGK